jgi:hypothetical protein
MADDTNFTQNTTVVAIDIEGVFKPANSLIA